MERMVITTLGTNTKRSIFSGTYIEENKKIAENVVAFIANSKTEVCFMQGVTPEMEAVFSKLEHYIFVGHYRCEGKQIEFSGKLLTFLQSVEARKEVLKKVKEQKSLKPLRTLEGVTAHYGNETAGILIQQKQNPNIGKTVDLPSKGIQRHYTEVTAEFQGLPTAFLTTHLTHDSKKMRLLQLEELFNHVAEQQKLGMPIIISGLFNIDKKDETEYSFLKDYINALGLQEAPVEENTYVAYDKNGELTKTSGIKSYTICSKEFCFKATPQVAPEQESFKHRPVTTEMVLSEYGLKKQKIYQEQLKSEEIGRHL